MCKDIIEQQEEVIGEPSSSLEGQGMSLAVKQQASTGHFQQVLK